MNEKIDVVISCPYRARGFTLVELIMVIILIGVLSALGIGLFARSSAFSPMLATQQLASATLLAQQAALAGNSLNTVTIRPNAGDLEFTAGGSTFSIDANGASIAYRRMNLATAFTTVSSTFTIGFDDMGWVASPNPREPLEFRISGDNTHFMCLSALGAVYQGRCDGS
jgi:MSHA pilin protein MshC